MNKDQPMLSRVADSLYWMSRYLERAEHISRLLDVHLNLMLDMAPGLVEQQRLQRLLDSLNLKLENLDVTNSQILRDLAFDQASHASIIANVTQGRDNARQIREQISSEMWTQINKLYLYVQQASRGGVWASAPHDFLLAVKEGSHLFEGITDATMNHNQGWHFIQIGRFMERAFGLLHLLDVHFNTGNLTFQDEISPNRYFELVATLKSVSAFEAYCKVYNPNMQPSWIIEFLLFNKEFPRSLRFCVEMILSSLHELAEETMRTRHSRLYRIAGRMQSNLSYDEIDDVRDLHHYTENIKQQIYQIHDMLYDTFITYPIESAL